MRRLAVALVVLAAAPAGADPVEVGGLSPESGPPGTVVRVSGRGFVAGTIVVVGGHLAALRGITRTEIHFVIPAEATDGLVTVRVPGSPSDVPAGMFRIERPFAATGLSPVEGAPGSRVEITGTGFLPGDRVRLGKRPVAVFERSATRLVVEVPDGARSDVFVVEREGASTRTARFVIRLPSPEPLPAPAPTAPPPAPAAPPGPPALSITSFTPSAGPAGTRVRVSGTAFGPDTRVLYGDRALAIVARDGTTELTVAVPLDAGQSAPFVVRSGGREVRSGSHFEIALAPTLTSLSPTAGPPGTRIVVTGKNLTGREELYLGAAAVPVLARSDGTLAADIPAGASSGPLFLELQGEKRPTPFAFEVIAPLAVTSFAPDSGPPGSEVRLAGRFGAATTVRYGGLLCAVKSRSPGRLVIVIPDAARAKDYLWVEDLGQRVRAADPFTVTR